MSDIVIERLKNSVGMHVIVFLNNGFRFEGKITGCDDSHLEILEPRGYKIIKIIEISDLDLSKGNKNES